MSDFWNRMGNAWDEAPDDPGGSKSDAPPDGTYQATIVGVEIREGESKTTRQFYAVFDWDLSIDVSPGYDPMRYTLGQFMTKNGRPDSTAVGWLKKNLGRCEYLPRDLQELRDERWQRGLVGRVIEIKVQRKGENVNIYFNKLISDGRVKLDNAPEYSGNGGKGGYDGRYAKNVDEMGAVPKRDKAPWEGNQDDPF